MAIQAWNAALSWNVARLCAKLPGVALHRYVLTAVPLTAMPRMPRGFAVARPSRETLVAADIVSGRAAVWRESQGMECVAVLRGAAIVGATWLVAGAFDEDEAHIRFVPPPGAAWDTGMVIAPGARGGRAFAALWAGTALWLQERGLSWSFSRIADYNLGSRRAHARLGAREVGGVSVLKLGSLQIALGARPGLTRLTHAPAIVRLAVPA